MIAHAPEALELQLPQVKGVADVHFRAERNAGLVEIHAVRPHFAEGYGAQSAQTQHKTGIDVPTRRVNDLRALTGEIRADCADHGAVTQNVPACLVAAVSKIYSSVFYEKHLNHPFRFGQTRGSPSSFIYFFRKAAIRG